MVPTWKFYNETVKRIALKTFFSSIKRQERKEIIKRFFLKIRIVQTEIFHLLKIQIVVYVGKRCAAQIGNNISGASNFSQRRQKWFETVFYCQSPQGK